MEIHFCDLCNESVPDSDLTAGKAVRRGERVICATCEGAMSASVASAALASKAAKDAGGAPPQPPVGPPAHHAHAHAHAANPKAGGARRAGGGGWLALVALLFSAGAGAWLAREFEAGKEEASVARARLSEDVRTLDDSRRDLLAAFDRRTTDLSSQLREGLGSLRQDLAGQISGLGDSQKASLARLGAAEEQLALIRSENQAEVLTLGERLDEVTAQLLRAREDASFYGERLAALEQAVQNGRGLAAAAPQPAPEAGGASGAPAWQSHVADLQSDNAGIRWSAVDSLGETGDTAVVPHIVPVLEDEDVFVRMAVARVLGDLASPLGIAPLIGALEDEEAVVRETAMLSLRSITGRNFKFDAVASPAERSKKVKAWQKWWEKAETEYFPDGQP